MGHVPYAWCVINYAYAMLYLYIYIYNHIATSWFNNFITPCVAGGHSGHIRWHAIPRHATPLHCDGARFYAGVCDNFCAQLSVRQAVFRGNPRTTRWLSGRSQCRRSHYACLPTYLLHAISKLAAKAEHIAHTPCVPKQLTAASWAEMEKKYLCLVCEFRAAAGIVRECQL